VIPNFVDRSIWHTNKEPCHRSTLAPGGEKIVMHVSNFRAVKRVEDVVEVFARIAKKVSARLVMVGDDKYLIDREGNPVTDKKLRKLVDSFPNNKYWTYARQLLSEGIGGITFKEKGGQLSVTIENLDNHVSIGIKDTGYGIAKKDMPHLFDPFYSTKDTNTGLGLSIAKSKIESLGGSVTVETEPKKGTTFTIAIPLSLAIIKNLFVEVGQRRYGIPVANVARLVTVDKKDIKGMMNYEAIILNEKDVPLTRLNALFKTPDLNPERQPIVIVRQGGEMLGLAVDAFLTTEEIVVRPLNKTVKENRNFSGSTIIGSGEVVLILDVANLMPTHTTAGTL